MTEELPKYIDARRALERRINVTGTISAARLERISEPFRPQEQVSVDAVFDNDDPRRPRLSGALRTEVGATCQRCLEPMVVKIDRLFDAFIITGTDDAQRNFDDDLDVLILENDQVDLGQFVEDEILLSLPMIPLHDSENCHRDKDEEVGMQQDTKKPFVGLDALLAAQKRENNDKP
jgi:uncharacterized protein